MAGRARVRPALERFDMKLTLETIKDAGGECEQVDLFERLFGAEVDVTPELCAEHDSKFDWNWAAEHLLTPTGLAEYQRVQAPAWAEYQRVQAPAWAEYERVLALAFGKLFSEQKHIA